MDDYKSRVELIGDLAKRFPTTEVTADNIKGYVWSLSDLSFSILSSAIDRCINSSKFFPTVAEIRENAEAISTGAGDGSHPDSCACFGTGMIVPEKVDGYSPGARRCDGAPKDEADLVDSW